MEDDSESDGFFTAYGSMEAQTLMLRDAPRLDAYAAAIEANRDSIRGRVVLDVGAGTGILSLLAARAGAARVFAVEAGPLGASLAEVAAQNGFGDVITVFACAVEDAQLPSQADVLVSEWMGFHLLHEAMLDSVLYARMRWLKAGGRMLPETARLFAAPVNMDSLCGERFGFLADVRGFDLSCFAPLAAQQLLEAPQVVVIDPSQLLAPPAEVFALNLNTATPADMLVPLGRPLQFIAQRAGVVHGYAIFFSVAFPADEGEAAVTLSTAPDCPPTHWKQTVVMLPDMLGAEAGLRLDCALRLRKDEHNPRHCVLDLEV